MEKISSAVDRILHVSNFYQNDGETLWAYRIRFMWIAGVAFHNELPCA